MTTSITDIKQNKAFVLAPGTKAFFFGKGIKFSVFPNFAKNILGLLRKKIMLMIGKSLPPHTKKTILKLNFDFVTKPHHVRKMTKHANPEPKI